MDSQLASGSGAEVCCALIDTLSSHPGVLCVSLGGSRSRGNARPDSDYDIFAVCEDGSLQELRRTLPALLERADRSILLFAEFYFLESFGYMFKGIDIKGMHFDVFVMPKHRLAEMAIQSTNLVFHDTDSLMRSRVDGLDDEPDVVSGNPEDALREVFGVFCINAARFAEEWSADRYWMAVRYLERMRLDAMRFDLMLAEGSATPRRVPEKVSTDPDFRRNYRIDGATSVKLVYERLRSIRFPDAQLAKS